MHPDLRAGARPIPGTVVDACRHGVSTGEEGRR